MGTSNGVLNDLPLFCHPVHFHGDKRCSLGVEPRGWGRRGHVPALHTLASLSILHTGHHMGRSAPLEVRVIKCRVLGGFHVGRVSREELIYIIGGVMNLRGSMTTSSTLVSPAGAGAASGPVVKKTSASILVRGHRVVHGPALGQPSAGRGRYSGGLRSCWHPVSLRDNLYARQRDTGASHGAEVYSKFFFVAPMVQSTTGEGC